MIDYQDVEQEREITLPDCQEEKKGMQIPKELIVDQRF